ncbi:MAG: hypothetical protein DMF72_19470 [Acidobacteria bacterium]|nr:MAG: hypothetical protein DMF72_19470 [Acidobacteriota bacterium]
MSMITDILATYLDAQKQLIEFEEVDKNNCLVSLPLHFSAHTRIELAIAQVSKNQFALTDQGQTITELKDAGVPVGSRLLERIKDIIQIWKVELVGVALFRTCNRRELGIALHEFGEAAKTVGDAYLSAHDYETDRHVEETLKDQVRRTFQTERYFYREQESIPGKIEAGHKVDFYIPPNGSNGLALEVLSKPNKLQAEAWGFRSRDMKEANQRLLVGFVYDEAARDLSRTILNSIADISLSATELIEFSGQLKAHHVSRGDAPKLQGN